MAGITLEQAEAQLATWIAASTAVAAGQSYTIKDRALSRVDAGEINKQINYWNTRVQRLTRGGGMRVRGVTPG